MRYVFSTIQIVAFALTMGLLSLLAAGEAHACDGCAPAPTEPVKTCPLREGFRVQRFELDHGRLVRCTYERIESIVHEAPPPTAAERLAMQSASYCANYPWAPQCSPPQPPPPVMAVPMYAPHWGMAWGGLGWGHHWGGHHRW